MRVDCDVVSIHVGVFFLSLLMVDLLTFIKSAMPAGDIFFLGHAEIVYLCSLVR